MYETESIVTFKQTETLFCFKASVMMDIVLTNISKDKKFYKEQKFVMLSSELQKEKLKVL